MSSWQVLKKRLKLRHLIILILLLVGNSFAWFVYATKMNADLSAHVRAWEILFQAGDSPVIDYVNVDIASMYPGMEEFMYELKASNNSEVNASVSYTLLSVTILGETELTVEGKNNEGLALTGTELTSVQLQQKLENDFPFKIAFSLSTEEMNAGNGISFFGITVNWPFESGDDVADTYWGEGAAAYKELYPTKSTISMVVKIVISQSED